MLRNIYKVIRLIVVLALLAAVAVPSMLYIGLSLPRVQEYARNETGKRLSELLGAHVEVGSLSITPFNRANLFRVAIVGGDGDTIAKADRLGAGLGLTDLLFHGRMVLNYVEAIGLDLRLYRDSVGAPLNIAPVMARLSKSGGDGGVPDLRINTIVIRRSRVSYDVLSAPPRLHGEFDPSHIAVTDLRADLRLSFDKEARSITVDLRRLAAGETRSGLVLSDLHTAMTLNKAPAPDGAIASVDLSGLTLAMPGSTVSIGPARIVLRPEPEIPLDIMSGSHVSLADLRPLLPPIVSERWSRVAESRIDLSATATVTRSRIDIGRLQLAVAGGAVTVDAPSGLLAEGLDSLAASRFSVPMLRVGVNPAATRLMPFPLHPADTLSPFVLPLIATIEADGTMAEGGMRVNFESGRAGNASIGIDYRIGPDRRLSHIEGSIDTENLGVGAIAEAVEHALGRHTALPAKLPALLTSTYEGNLTFDRRDAIPRGTLSAYIAQADVRRRDGSPVTLTDIIADVTSDGNAVTATAESANDGLAFSADITADIRERSGIFDITLDDLDLSLKGGEHLSLTATGSLRLMPGGSPLPATGRLDLHDLLLRKPLSETRGLSIPWLTAVSAIPVDSLSAPTVDIKSDIFEARLSGSLNPATLMADMRDIGHYLLPGLVEPVAAKERGRSAPNDFTIDMRLLSSAPIEEVVKLPVQIRYPVNVSAWLNTPLHTAGIEIDAPYLWQGKKEIDSTRVTARADGTALNIAARSSMPTKNGMMTLDFTAAMPEAREGDTLRVMHTGLGWKVDATRDFSGTVSLDITPSRDPDSRDGLMAAIGINPSKLVFNDTAWVMEPSTVTVSRGLIDVDGFCVGRSGQFVKIDGKVTSSPADTLSVNLASVDLDYVFETLNIPNAMFGGTATGNVKAAGILGADMTAYTDDLYVKGLKYNFSLMGDTHIKASYDPEVPAVNIDAVVDQPNGLHSYIDGYIKPTSEGYIDLRFDADRIEVGFMKPFMSAFASAVKGYASGNAHLFGTFHDVNMSGDIYAEDLALTLDFTGTTYYATDSVHLTPGNIDLNGITLRDREGHTARLSGYLHHTNFHEPRFQFRITDADDLLVYDLPESPDRRWYGTIYGDGSATVTGIPGKIDIVVNMATAPRSTFTFILSDAEEAYEYNFITFRDRDKGAGGGGVDEDDAGGIPAEVAEIRRSLARKQAEEQSSIYDMAISVRVNPDALLTVVMDPIGGDAIKARGNGDLTMTYNSASEDLGLRGDYTLDNGTYNFTFQDIIRKDFRINPGSAIRFTGDPYAAQLDIEAAYRLTANLSDLDESFLDDPELTRTSVPVDAIINVTGDMRAPDLDYDFAFPTLKDDVKRKVNSIVSTDDMRARQMLYLLALNRFYTPEYMSATKGNELFSVASSTISSQLSNLLGSLSENWTIAPNLRSDRGDFSDVEFDLALSSSLLNNRLLFNGNFGYRDKSLNSNTFIGDFDLEYLLNRSGSLRLKAYNRYNDQNFYVKNALTTQGVGIVFRRDFDSLTSWLKALGKKKKKEEDDDATQNPGR